MNDLSHLKQRYEQDEPPIQLGGLASNLSRIAWYAQRADQAGLVSLLRESKYFTEWAAPRCSLEQQGLLAELQLQLAIWERGVANRIRASRIAQEAKQWSAKLLDVSGLVRP